MSQGRLLRISTKIALAASVLVMALSCASQSGSDAEAITAKGVQDPIYLDAGFPGEVEAEDGLSSLRPGTLSSGNGPWQVYAQDPGDVQVTADPSVGLNYAPKQIALGSSGATRLVLPLKSALSTGRAKVSFNLAFLKDTQPPSFSVSLADMDGKKGPSVRFDLDQWSRNGKAFVSAAGSPAIPLVPFVSGKSSAYPPYSRAFLSTIRLVADLDSGVFTFERNLEFARENYKPSNDREYLFSGKGPFTAVEITVPKNPATTGRVFLSSVVAEGNVMSSGELDRLMLERRMSLKKAAPLPDSRPDMPRNTKDLNGAVIWQTNPVIHTPNGRFDEYNKLIPRLRELGVTMVYFVPLWKSNTSPVGGLIGFPIHDGYSLNPAFGEPASFRALVSELHRSGIKVIVDFAFHSVAWSSPMVREHPEWLVKEPGEAFYDGYQKPLERKRWIYMYRLDFEFEQVQQAVASMMKHWVREYDIDGFRLDVAHTMFNSSTLPRTYTARGVRYRAVDVVRRLKEEVAKAKPGVIFLAESANPGMTRNGADLEYSGFWRLRSKLKDCSSGQMDFRDIVNTVSQSIPGEFDDTGLFLWGLETHDFEPATVAGPEPQDGFGLERSRLYMSLISTIPGAVVIFGGQEEGDRFFYQNGFGDSMLNVHSVKQAPVEGMYAFYRRLFDLRRTLALNEGHPSEVIDLKPDSPDVAAYIRETPTGVYSVVLNHSSNAAEASLKVPARFSGAGPFMAVDLVTGASQQLKSVESVNVQPWSALLITLKQM